MLDAKTIVMRLPGSINGLRDMIKAIDAVRDTKSMKMVEIGCFKGDSTKVFCETFGKVTTIDPWECNIGDITDKCDMAEVFDLAKENLKGCNNLVILKAYAQDVINTFKRHSVHFVYIDSSHTYEDTCKEIESWLLKVKAGGFIGGHDYSKKFPGVVKAVNKFFTAKGFKVMTFKDTSWLVKLKGKEDDEDKNDSRDGE